MTTRTPPIPEIWGSPLGSLADGGKKSGFGLEKEQTHRLRQDLMHLRIHDLTDAEPLSIFSDGF